MVYVDDVAITLKNLQEFLDQLMDPKKYGFKLKGSGLISFHLGMDFYRDDDGTLCLGQKKYVECMLLAYEHMFSEAPKQNVTSPIEKGDHLELDTSPL